MVRTTDETFHKEQFKHGKGEEDAMDGMFVLPSSYVEGLTHTHTHKIYIFYYIQHCIQSYEYLVTFPPFISLPLKPNSFTYWPSMI